MIESGCKMNGLGGGGTPEGGPRALAGRIAAALAAEDGFAAAYLYGSCASGEARPFSDVDVAVLPSAGTAPPEALLRAQGRIQSALGRGDVHVTDLAGASAQLRYEVAARGIPVVVRDRRADVLFRADAFVRYIDLRPLLQIHRAATLRVRGA